MLETRRLIRSLSGHGMRRDLLVGLMLLFSSAAIGETGGDKANGCLQRTASLRLEVISKIILACTVLINDHSVRESARPELFAQRGTLHARRWRLTDSSQDASLGIADLSEALSFNSLRNDRRQLLLTWRGEIFEALRQDAKAADDFRAVLSIAPTDEKARAALRRLDIPTN